MNNSFTEKTSIVLVVHWHCLSLQWRSQPENLGGKKFWGI